MNKRWKKILLFVGLPIVVGGLIYWFAWAGTTKPIEAVADQLKVPSSWELTQNDVKAPGLCIAETCPDLSRSWRTPELQSREQITKLAEESGWNGLEPDADCNEASCSLDGIVDGYRVSLKSFTVNEGDPPKVYLSIR